MKIEKKITGYAVKKPTEPEVFIPDEMHEGVKRPDVLVGTTYKIKTPSSDHALYITVNDLVLNAGTEHEVKRPYEVFINSKNMEHFQWVVALTRVISAVFRKGGDVCFLVEELRAVFDPRGGYYKKGGVFMPSLVAEIGFTLERHFKANGLLKDEADPAMLGFIEKKREELAANDAGEYPAHATLCQKCSVKAVVVLDGCQTCLSCGDSKCG